MKDLTEPVASFNRNPSIWSNEFRFNGREFIRAEMTEYKGRSIVNLRKWFVPDDGDLPRPTKEGIAFAIRHLPALAKLVNDTLAQARAEGLLPQDELNGGRE